MRNTQRVRLGNLKVGCIGFGNGATDFFFFGGVGGGNLLIPTIAFLSLSHSPSLICTNSENFIMMKLFMIVVK